MKHIAASLLLAIAYTVTAQTGDLLKVNATELFVTAIGSGPPVVVIHGGPGLNHDYFLPHLLPLARTHKLVFYDQRACGRSSARLDSTQMTMAWLIKDIESIRTKLGLGKITLMAHSWGGLLGMLYATEYPENIDKFILVSSVGPKSGEFDQEINRTTITRFTKEDSTLRTQTIRSDAFRRGDVEAFAKVFSITFSSSFYDRRYADSLDLNLPADFATRRAIFFFMSAELAQYDHYPLVKRIKCPTLIIHGDYDPLPLALAEKIQKRIPGSRLETIRQAGHFPFIEKKDEFVRIVSTFLDR